MVTMRLRYVHEYVDRHGRVRRYFRKGTAKRISLPGHPGSREFMQAYQAALDGYEQPGPTPIGLDRSPPGSLSALIASYYSSAAFKALARITKATYRTEIERLRREHGDKPIALMRREHVKKIVAAKAERPGAANKTLRIIRMLMRFAVDEGVRPDDPTMGIRKIRTRTQGFKAWTDDDIDLFETRFPVGSRERLAFSLLLYTAQRRSDVIRMGWQHVRDGKIAVMQQKTSASLWIPIHPALLSVLTATPRDNMTFLVTAAGKPFSPAGFGNWFGDSCREAGLPVGYNAHGLRKAAARRLAEAGCTSQQIMAVTGHRSLGEVERYTREVDQVALATEAMSMLEGKTETSSG